MTSTTCRLFHYLFVVLVSSLSYSCEISVPLNNPSNLSSISLNSIAEEGKPFELFVTNSFYYPALLDKVNNAWDPTGSAFKAILDWPYEIVYSDPWTLNPKDADIVSWGIIKDAIATLTINDDNYFSLSFDENRLCYSCPYIPQRGDKLSITVSAEKQKASASAIVPQRPKLEVLEVEKFALIADGDKLSISTSTETYPCDTLVRLHCRIPTIEKKGWYRIHCKVRVGLGKGYKLKYHDMLVKEYCEDIFYSASDIFRDERLSVNWHKIPPEFCSAFTSEKATQNQLFFVDVIATPDVRLRDLIENTTVSIELQAISKELYNFIKESMLYRITPRDKFTVPVIIPSNVTGGSGFFGSLSSDSYSFSLDKAIFKGNLDIQDLNYLKYYYGEAYKWEE